MKFIWEMDEFEHKGMVIFATFEIEAEYVASHGYWNADWVSIKQPDGSKLRIDDEKDWQWVMPLINDWLNDPDNLQMGDAASEILYERKVA